MTKSTTKKIAATLFTLFVLAGGPAASESIDDDTMIDIAATMIVYHGYCAKLPPEVKALAEKIALMAPDRTVWAGVKKKKEHDQMGSAWCSHYRGVISRATAAMN